VDEDYGVNALSSVFRRGVCRFVRIALPLSSRLQGPPVMGLSMCFLFSPDPGTLSFSANGFMFARGIVPGPTSASD